MALLKRVELPNGLVVENAYHRIDTLMGDKLTATVQVNSYLSQADYNNGKAALDSKGYTFGLCLEEGAVNFIRQGYEYLKTLSEFTGYIDA